MFNLLQRATRRFSAPLVGGLLLSFSIAVPVTAGAETPAALPMLTQPVDNASRVTLQGTVHPLAKARYDRGAVSASLQAPRIQLMLKRPADREAALKQFITDVHTKGSPNYHKWLTPDQFGKQYGPADSDIAAVNAWLQSQGFAVNKVSRGKSIVEFGGTAGQIQAAFGTPIHKYVVNGETHYANSAPIQIPSALTPIVKGLVALNNFKLKSDAKVMGQGTYAPKTHKGTANWTYPFSANSSEYYLAPGDFAVQYDTQPLLNAGTNGAGVTIGIINDSNVDLTLVNAYRTLFSLPANPPQVIIDGNDPGVNSDSIEAYLDVEESGAVAPGATIDLYVGEDTSLSAGLDLATVRAVDDDVAQVLNLSFGACEYELLSSGNAFYAQVWEQAAAQGQTVMVSSGDSGSEACYNSGETNPIYGLSVSGTASTPYNVAVGGTDFYYSDYTSAQSGFLPASFSTYWNETQSDTPATSLLTPIPEQPWNGSIHGDNLVAANSANDIVGGGGGVSNCSLQTDTFNQDGSVASQVCNGGYAKPSYQSELTPADSVRDLPDVSLFASNGYNYSIYPVCALPGDCNSDGQSNSPATVTGVGGTSASSPAFAGIMAMVVQKYGSQGQANYTLYPLAAQFPAAFHDVRTGDNAEPCDPNTAYTQLSLCSPDSNGNDAIQDYPAGIGYDLASGLGSVDANVLVTDWNSVTFTPTTTTLTVSPAAITHGATVTLTANVASPSATGDVAFTAAAPSIANTGLGFVTLVNGVASATSPSTTAAIGVLPGGTYNLTAQYEGDGTYAPSSATQSVTVSPEASTTYANAYDYYFGTVIPAASANVPYGTSITIEARPVGNSVTQASGATAATAASDGAATGAVAFTDSGTSATIPVNVSGIASWNPGTFAIGPHSVTAAYAGDASFNASTSAPVTFTVVKGTPQLIVEPFLNGQITGSSITVQAYLCNPETTNSGTYCGYGAGTAPTGTVTFTLGGLTQTATVVPFSSGTSGGVSGAGSANYGSASATFTNLPSGVTSIGASYSGDSNWNTVSNYSTAFQTGSSTATATTTTLTATPASGTNQASSISITSTITGTGTLAPTGTLYITSGGNSIASFKLTAVAGVVSISGDIVTVTASLPGYAPFGGVDQFVAVYSGDNTYLPSTSPVVNVAVDQSDFTLSTQNASVTIAPGSSGTATVNLNSVAGLNGTVKLSCSSLTAGITCSVPSTVAVNGTATAAVTINVATGTVKNELRPLWIMGGGAALACAVFFGIPARRRAWRSLLGVVVFTILTANFGCGGGGGGGGGTKQTATPVISPASGTYTSAQSVTITDATSGAAIYYTVDGTTPTASSKTYGGAITVATTQTVSAIAIASGDSASAVASATYTITTSIPPTTNGTNPTSHNVTIQVLDPSTGALLGSVVVTGTI